MGGAGGRGGRYGKFIFKNLVQSYSKSNSKSKPTIFSNDGSFGKSGKDAKPCENLALDVRIDIELRKVVFIALPLHHSFSSHFTILNHIKSSKCSPEYAQNNETIILTESIEPKEIDLETSLIRYKRFLIENMKNSSLTSIVQKMYEAIDEDWELSDKDTLRGLILEAYELEKNYFELSRSIEVISIYQRLFERVNKMRRKNNSFDRILYAKVDQRKEDDDRALSYLKTILKVKFDDISRDNNLIVKLVVEDLGKIT